MKLRYSLVALSLITAPSWAVNNWFLEQTSLTNAHQFLLEGNLEESFDAMIQTWQKEPEAPIRSHLDQLLLKALDKDCGRSFDNSKLPKWLDKLAIQRQAIQSPGRLSYRLKIDAQSDVELKQITFTKWPDQVVMSNVNTPEKIDNQHWKYSQRVDLNAQLDTGLYKIRISTEQGKEWESWILLAHPNHKQTVRWSSKEEWVVDKTALLNRFCPLPVMDVALYGNVDGDYKEVWNKEYESDYPTQVPETKLPADRYLLGVSIIHKRWQGAITIEDKQILNKAFDISE
ncbi:DUF2861 family protein [Vibrio rumoiensis]|uniref:DUF2861 family protein n=1 Tax=Vibrio rumoiensis TaxID=76258 RepID=A0ABW7IXY7_9VIBR|nr:DUF2861 family protein [Vibrio rumoiensis]